jgi:hypothetical protein
MENHKRASLILKLAKNLNDQSVNSERSLGIAKALDELSDDEFIKACTLVNKKFRKVPAPIDFYELVKKATNSKNESIDVAARIIGAVPEFGYARGNDAREYIGELGWQVVQRFGGWTTVCEGLTVQNEAMKYAQFREVANAMMERRALGIDHCAPNIDLNYDKKEKIGKTESAGDIAENMLKQIEEKKKQNENSESEVSDAN